MRFLVSLVFACSLAAVLSAAATTSATRPNIVFMLADDLGWADIASFGAKDIRTPHLDRLADQGVRFTQFYANGPECSPTRAALLTGRYQQRVGGLECAIGLGNVGRYDDAIRLAGQHELGLPVAETSLARLLKDAGYATAISGKWHLGYEEKFGPNRHGFDHAFYSVGGGMDYFHHIEDPTEHESSLRLDGEPIKREGYFTELIADDATRWLNDHVARNARQPFFLYVPFTAPHSPFQAPNEKFPEPLPAGSPRWKQGNAPAHVYTAMIESMDAAAGRILATLEQHHLSDSTIVVFTSDNGGTRSARPTGLRGQKGSTYEGGIRVPCIVRWPGRIPAGTHFSHPAMTFDLTASIAHAAGVKPAKNRPFDGVDILTVVQSQAAPPERALFWRGRRGGRTWRAVREGVLKYVSLQNGAKIEEGLFDIERDRGEQQDLLAHRPADVERFKQMLAKWETDVRAAR